MQRYVFNPEETHMLDSQIALHVLCNYLLGDSYYIVDPVSPKQGNAIMVEDILKLYSKRYKKEAKKREYQKRHPNDRQIRIFGLCITIRKEK